MNLYEFTSLVGLGSFFAGFLGSLTGLGGGVVIVPLLTLAFGVDIHYAIGASLVSVIATSSGSAASHVKQGFSNLRIGMFLEIATTTGAVMGAGLATRLSSGIIAVIFGGVLMFSAYLSSRPRYEGIGDAPASSVWARLRLDASYPTTKGPKSYRVRGIPAGFSLMFVAGTLSGILGIGSGALKVLALDQAMKLPFKVSTATSNFMIGVTAAASAGVYLNRGYIDPAVALPVMLMVLLGSMSGARVLIGAKTKILRRVFALVLFVIGVQMIYKGITGSF